MTRHAKHFAVLVAAAALSPAALAQFDNQWVQFANDTHNRIQNPDGSLATQVTANTDEKHFAFGDFNGDGFMDLVMVTKNPASYPGGRQGFLLINNGAGVLVDRTAQYGIDSDFAGSMGLLDLVDSRKVKAVDVNGDGLLDLVTCATNLGSESSNPKYISHPRVYINKGFDGSGNWLGFRYEESRIPTLLGANGQTAAPRFCSVAVGDVTGDGFPDIYLVQYHGTETGYGDNANNTNGDRLLINDGTGFFTDSGTTRVPQSQLNSSFGTETKILDINGDGFNDISKCSTLDSPIRVAIDYNNPTNVGFFPATTFQTMNPSGSPYHIDYGDLNNDGKLDLVISDDSADMYLFNTGNDALGRVNWSPGHTFQFVNASDDGFGSENHIVDLNNDGFNDVLISDFDHDLAGCTRRCHIYHNLGGPVGSTSIVLKEEAGSSGWFGANGFMASDLGGTFDEAVFDIDNDGDNDIVIGRCSGTYVWINQESNCTFVKYGTPVANSTGKPAILGYQGTTSLSHNDFYLKTTQCPHNKTCLYIYGTAQSSPVPFGDGVREIGGQIRRMATTSTDANGNQSFHADFTTAPLNTLVPGNTRYFMLWYRDPTGGPNGYNGSSALQATVCP
jgi:FG-GAP-like repeat